MTSSFLGKIAERIHEKRITMQVALIRKAGVDESLISEVVTEARKTRNFEPLTTLCNDVYLQHTRNARRAYEDVVANSTAMADEVDDQVRVPVDHVGHRMEPRF